MLQLVGAFEKNPSRGRARANEPAPEGEVGDPPEDFSLPECAAWREICQISHAGVLCRSDRLSVELAARLLAEYRLAPLTFPNARLLRLQVLLSSFGMTPADRSRVTAASTPGTINRFAQLAARR